MPTPHQLSQAARLVREAAAARFPRPRGGGPPPPLAGAPLNLPRPHVMPGGPPPTQPSFSPGSGPLQIGERRELGGGFALSRMAAGEGDWTFGIVGPKNYRVEVRLYERLGDPTRADTYIESIDLQGRRRFTPLPVGTVPGEIIRRVMAEIKQVLPESITHVRGQRTGGAHHVAAARSGNWLSGEQTIRLPRRR